ncbi:glycosyl transferase group 2 family protein [Hyphomonas oceanitis SCH89]|uniref:Glycosyl transferase group 2 family protein n=2 Tax=Hyphomonas oceanitis TaxID=81033 RepID=A0A059G6R0_9PROT|nr:glycosyl transferase group 2 family protein [Hyphomonas oceanitis SCH89]
MGADGFIFSGQGEAIRHGELPQPAPDPDMAERAALGFAQAFPGQSAMSALTQPQVQVFRRGAIAAGICGLLAPGLLLQALMLAGLGLFGLILAFRVWLVATGCFLPSRRSPVPAVDVLLPIYTILIALKDEAGSAGQLSRAMRGLDYPADRLDLKLLIETGDEATRTALLAEAWPQGTELLVLPTGLPRTKPRALNYGLERARGAYVVVYDAEDRPDPDQLRTAARAFAVGPATLACVQAPLIGVPEHGNWLSRQWALEYAIQFGRVLPALANYGLPIALGGTSNHFKRSKLVEAGGWDAWNVTEDADLGLRLARCGARVGVISPPTLEAPPRHASVWLAQRSRWLKGFLQTWLVLMRTPLSAAREMGWGGFLSMQLTLGAAILSALVHGPWALWCLVCLLAPGLHLGTLGTCLMVVSYIIGIATGLAAPRRDGAGAIAAALTSPVYWPLQSIAMARALYGLWHQPHFWAKTPHDAPVV